MSDTATCQGRRVSILRRPRADSVPEDARNRRRGLRHVRGGPLRCQTPDFVKGDLCRARARLSTARAPARGIRLGRLLALAGFSQDARAPRAARLKTLNRQTRRPAGSVARLYDTMSDAGKGLPNETSALCRDLVAAISLRSRDVPRAHDRASPRPRTRDPRRRAARSPAASLARGPAAARRRSRPLPRPSCSGSSPARPR